MSSIWTYPVPASELINYTDENGLSCWTDPDPWPRIMYERRLEAERKATMDAECRAMIEREIERRGLKHAASDIQATNAGLD